MKVTCNVIRDLLPLYLENIASDDTCTMVEKHISLCEDCRKQLDEMKLYINPPIDTDVAPLRNLKATLRKKKLQTIIFSVMLTMVFASITIAFFTAPKYIPYSEGTVSLIEKDNGAVLALFSDKVSGYDISSYPNDDNTGYVYNITAWDSIWNRNIAKNTANNTVLNPNGEEVDSVYYYMTNGSEDRLIYGNDQNPDGGTFTLPRLVLAYYLVIDLALAILCGIIMLVFRGYEKVKNVTIKILFLPISYLLGHLCIKGFTTSSYSAARDFFAILLVMIPLYIVFLSAISLIREYRNGKK
jgi:hypothetical protein